MIGASPSGAEVVGIAYDEGAVVVARAPGGAAAVVAGLDGTLRDPAVRFPAGDATKMFLEAVGRVVVVEGRLVDAAVVAVPAWADDACRQRLAAAAAEVGLELVAIVDAATAATRAWGGLGRPMVAALDRRALSVGMTAGAREHDGEAAEALARALLEGLGPRACGADLAAALRCLETGGRELEVSGGRIALDPAEVARWLAPGLAPIAAAVRRACAAAGEVDVVIPVGALWRAPGAIPCLAEASGVAVAMERDPGHWVALGAALDGGRAAAGAADVTVAALVARYRSGRSGGASD
jgi:hypothetical protein